MVLHRRSGEREPLRRPQPPGGLRPLGARVLDRLRLVEHGHLPLLRAQHLDVALQQGVRRQHHVVAGYLREALGTVGAGEREHSQMRNESRDLGTPVRRDARRRDDQHRFCEASRGLFDRDVREQLDRFAQTHVVGQHAAEIVACEQLQPGDAALLILAQRTFEGPRHHRRRHGLFVGERADEIAQARARGPAHGRRAFELADRGEVRRREREAPFAGERCVEEFDQRR